jgi:hypothetical protein
MRVYSREEHATYVAGLIISAVPTETFEQEVNAVHRLVGKLLPIVIASRKGRRVEPQDD